MGFDQSLFFIYFIYGLAFFGMGLAMAMESWRASSLAGARVLLPLAGFGLIHGTHEWMESYLLQAGSLGTPLPEWLPWLKLGFLVSSFVSLALFAFQSLWLVPPPVPAPLKHAGFVLPVYIIIILTSCGLSYPRLGVGFPILLDVMTRYLLAIPASLLAALGLFYTGRYGYQSNRAISGWLSGAGIGFGLYAVTQLFVHPTGMFPANLINTDSFRVALGFPIQMARTLAAIIITVCLLRATQLTEELRRTELLNAQQARLAALEEQQVIRRELLQHTVHAQEDERARIARELHDETAQTLSAFTLELATLQNDKLRKPENKQIVERLQALSRDMSQGLYRLVRDLRPAQLDDLGLVPALRFLIEQDLHQGGIEIAFDVRGTPHRLDPLMETVLFRVAQEALTNLARHAQVREGRLEIIFAKNDVTLRVSDNGRGFDPTENFRPPHGWGLAGMKERIEAVGGTLSVHSAPGQGTLIEAFIPMEDKESA
jgi:signal transduction histidine kinase